MMDVNKIKFIISVFFIQILIATSCINVNKQNNQNTSELQSKVQDTNNDSPQIIESKVYEDFELKLNDSCQVANKIRMNLIKYLRNPDFYTSISELMSLLDKNSNQKICSFPRNSEEQYLVITFIKKLSENCDSLKKINLVFKIRDEFNDNVELQEVIQNIIPTIAVNNTHLFLEAVNGYNRNEKLQIIEGFEYIKTKKIVIQLMNNLENINDESLKEAKDIAIEKLTKEYGSVLKQVENFSNTK